MRTAMAAFVACIVCVPMVARGQDGRVFRGVDLIDGRTTADVLGDAADKAEAPKAKAKTTEAIWRETEATAESTWKETEAAMQKLEQSISNARFMIEKNLEERAKEGVRPDLRFHGFNGAPAEQQSAQAPVNIPLIIGEEEALLGIPPAHAPTWDYQAISGGDLDALNALFKKGWEPSQVVAGAAKKNGTFLILKRARPVTTKRGDAEAKAASYFEAWPIDQENAAVVEGVRRTLVELGLEEKASGEGKPIQFHANEATLRKLRHTNVISLLPDGHVMTGREVDAIQQRAIEAIEPRK